MKKTYLSLLFIVAMATAAYGQIGFEAGVNASNLSIKLNDTKVSTKFLIGETIGLFVDIPLSDEQRFYLEPGLFYQTNGAGVGSDPTYKYIISAANFPLYIEYKSGDRCSQRFFAGIGPYFGDNITNSDGFDMENLSLGLALNLGYIGRKHWYVRAHYQAGLINELPGGDAKNDVKQSCASLTIGYMVRGCKVHYGFGSSRSEKGNHWRGIKKSRWSTHQRLYRVKGPARY